MNARSNQRRFRLPSYWPWILGGLLLLFLAWWLVPRRTTEVVSVDGEHRWVHYEAPPRRQVLWTPARRVEDLPLESGPRDSLIRPALAEGGSLLYFTVRKSGGDLDIYQSRLLDDRWQAATSVAELNTEFNDIGPVVRSDGQELYLYSNRPGGYGGYDIYICQRTESGWSEPRNAGPLVNSPANEYDPAAAPHGKHLFYASDRTRAMHQWVAAGKQVDAADEWKTTLRAQRGLIQFDLYQARRADRESPWEVGRPLSSLNSPTANEGAPFIDPWGAFVYFVSDRPRREGEEANYDIYRARLDGELVGGPENLGRGVNTPHNEVEPALSPEGYRLLFSRELEQQPDDASPQDELYALYSSTATEVYAEGSWDDSAWRALLLFFHQWWLELLLLALVVLLAALIYWLLRQKWVRRLSVPTFLLLALLFHLMFGVGSFFVYLGGDIVEQIAERYVDPGTVIDNLETSEPAAPQPFEEVADLESVESIEVAETPRQVTQSQNVPVEVQDYQPTISAQLARELPPEQVITLPPKLSTPAPSEPQLARRELQQPTDMLSPTQVQPEQAQPQESPASEPQTIASTEVTTQRSATTPSEQTAPNPLQRRSRVSPAALANAAESQVQPAREATAQPATSAAEASPSIARRSMTQAAVADSAPVEVQQMTPATGDASTQQVEVGAAEVAVNRSEQASSPLQVEQVQARRASTPASKPTPTGTEARRPTQSEAEVTDIAFSAQVANPLSGRQTRLPDAMTQGEVERVELPSASGTAGEATSANNAPAAAQVALNKRRLGSELNVATPAELGGSTRPATSGPKLENTQLAATGNSSQPPGGIAADSENPAMQRRSPTGKLTNMADSAVATVQLPGNQQGAPGETSLDAQAGVEVGLTRNDTPAMKLSVATPTELAGPRRPRRSDLTVGRLGPIENHAQPSLGPVANQLARRSTTASPLMFAEENVGLAAMFRLRMSDTRQSLVEEFGGSDATEQAVRRGLLWINAHQNEDGSWSLNHFDRQCDDHKKCSGHGGVESNTAATGFALLPFLGAGHTHQEGPYQNTIDQGLQWLLKNQKDDGDLSRGSKGNAQMYSHGIATIALCEALGMSKDRRLAEPAQRAVEFIVNAQDPKSGGWRYHPRQSGDTSVVGWQIMALKSAQMAEVEVPEQTLELARKWIDRVEGKGNRQGWFGYTNPNDRGNDPTMTAEALLCSQYLGAQRGDQSLRRGADHLLKQLPQKGKVSSYYWYYGTQCMYHMQGEHWRRWNERMSSMLVETQRHEGPMAGTWDPDDRWENQGGRIMSTSLRLLMLEVYYRHLPLYQVLE